MSENHPTDEAPVNLDLYPPAEFILEPCVGMSICTDQHPIWLSWEETQKLAEFLRRYVAA